MASIKVLAGDFTKGGAATYNFGVLQIPDAEHWFLGRKYDLKNGDAVTLEEANERSVVKVGGAAGWGVAGAALLGPAGLLAGLVLGGRGARVAFVAEFKDGKRLLGEVDKAIWLKMKADVFR